MPRANRFHLPGYVWHLTDRYGTRGRLYVAQVSASATNTRIFRINENGTVTTVVGGGTNNSNGVIATNALITPQGISFGPDGYLYVADAPSGGGNHRVFRVDLEAPTPVIETVAGAGPRWVG